MLLKFVIFCLFLNFINANCPPGSTEWKSKCYIVVGPTSGFSRAEKFCIEAGGHLPSIHDAFTNSLIAQTFSQSDDIWVGGNSFESIGNWTWMDETSFDYTNWKNESDAEATNRCVSLSVTDGYWTADDCFKHKGFACAVPISYFTTTTTTTTTAKPTSKNIVQLPSQNPLVSLDKDPIDDVEDDSPDDDSDEE